MKDQSKRRKTETLSQLPATSGFWARISLSSALLSAEVGPNFSAMVQRTQWLKTL